MEYHTITTDRTHKKQSHQSSSCWDFILLISWIQNAFHIFRKLRKISTTIQPFSLAKAPEASEKFRIQQLATANVGMNIIDCKLLVKQFIFFCSLRSEMKIDARQCVLTTAVGYNFLINLCEHEICISVRLVVRLENVNKFNYIEIEEFSGCIKCDSPKVLHNFLTTYRTNAMLLIYSIVNCWDEDET